jgi:pSer/pThr/pTyr-binding forkhead associated (FHA) protein
MDRSHQPAENGLPLQGPHWKSAAGLTTAGPGPVCLPADFRPLTLVLEAGGLTITLTQPDMLVGRHTQADIRLPLPDVSRHHCRFLFRSGGWRMIDLQSLNGVYVNGEQVQEAALQDGDAIVIGSCHFKVKTEARQAEDAIKPQEAPNRTGILPQLPNLGTRQRKAS